MYPALSRLQKAVRDPDRQDARPMDRAVGNWAMASASAELDLGTVRRAADEFPGRAVHSRRACLLRSGKAAPGFRQTRLALPADVLFPLWGACPTQQGE